jgi:hypothetical protein
MSGRIYLTPLTVGRSRIRDISHLADLLERPTRVRGDSCLGERSAHPTSALLQAHDPPKDGGDGTAPGKRVVGDSEGAGRRTGPRRWVTIECGTTALLPSIKRAGAVEEEIGHVADVTDAAGFYFASDTSSICRFKGAHCAQQFHQLVTTTAVSTIRCCGPDHRGGDHLRSVYRGTRTIAGFDPDGTDLLRFGSPDTDDRYIGRLHRSQFGGTSPLR